MEWTIRRKEFYDDRTIAHFLNGDSLFSYCLEDFDRKLEADGIKVMKETAIPRGRYRLVIDWSPHFNRDMPHILDVPQFDGIRIHDGAGPAETEGCPLISYDMRIKDGKHWLVRGSGAFNNFFALLSASLSTGERSWVTVE